MGIFNDIGKTIKKAAPIIGGTIGFMVGGPTGAAIGSGLGGLASGRSVEESLGYAAMGYGIGSLGAGMGYGPTAAAQQSAAANTAAAATQKANIASASVDPGMAQGLVGTEGAAAGSSVLGGIGDFIAENKLLSAGLGIGALGMLAGGMEEEDEATPYQETRAGRPYETKVKGPITGTTYNLANEDEVEAYNNELLQLREKSFKYEMGGEVTGPGTGTSDSVPARLSDGEFVLTAKAVRGAGNGDRDIGAARMYDMMAELESMA